MATCRRRTKILLVSLSLTCSSLCPLRRGRRGGGVPIKEKSTNIGEDSKTQLICEKKAEEGQISSCRSTASKSVIIHKFQRNITYQSSKQILLRRSRNNQRTPARTDGQGSRTWLHVRLDQQEFASPNGIQGQQQTTITPHNPSNSKEQSRNGPNAVQMWSSVHGPKGCPKAKISDYKQDYAGKQKDFEDFEKVLRYGRGSSGGGKEERKLGAPSVGSSPPPLGYSPEHARYAAALIIKAIKEWSLGYHRDLLTSADINSVEHFRGPDLSDLSKIWDSLGIPRSGDEV
ncbi:hypothetical protein EDB19DRAFT_1838796 [Suillus lakei]|nr:hypothetical protein EDB19DRAFT_1838796 [Suillus lakei]